MKKRSRKSSLVSSIIAVRVVKGEIGKKKLKIISWAHSEKDNILKKLIRLIDAPPKPYLDEKEYRWASDCAADDLSGCWLATENTSITGVVASDVLRLRANISNTGTKDAKVYLGLQYSDDGGATWYALGGAPDAPATPHFEYYDGKATDKASVVYIYLTSSDTAGVYIESVPTNQITIAVGTCVEFDVCIHCTTNALSNTTYLFKLVITDDLGNYSADLDSYTTQPELVTGTIVPPPKTKTYTADTLIKKLTISKTYSSDTLLKAVLAKTYTADSLLKNLDLLKTYTSDILIKKLKTLKTYVSDTILIIRGTKTYTSDLMIKGVDLTKTYTSDILLKKFKETVTYVADVILIIPPKLVHYPVDVILLSWKQMRFEVICHSNNPNRFDDINSELEITLDNQITKGNITSYIINRGFTKPLHKTYYEEGEV